MACATLKRSLEWDTILGGSHPKRRRCTPWGSSSPTQRDRNGDRSSSSSPSSSPSYASQQQSAASSAVQLPPSAFPNLLKTKLTPEYMAANITAELKRMQRRRQLKYRMDNSDSSGSETGDSPIRCNKPLFTFKQVGMICERMLQERESELRQEYDNILTEKLAEQYEAFVKFTYDQIHRTYTSDTTPSYLS